MLKFIAIASLVFLAGCGQNYRYPCQDPANWDKAECKKPICEVNKDCPEYIFKDEKVVSKPSAPQPPVKGECK